MNEIEKKVQSIGVVPVIKLNHPERDAIPLAKALIAGGVPVAEVTFRAAGAAVAIKAMRENFPEMLVGAGTVLTTEQVDEAMAAGAQFIVTPGMDPAAFAAAGQLCDGLIIESYGMGGIPDVYLEELDKLIRQGKTVIMATQVPQEGSDLSVYQVGKHVKDRYHLLETYDMTLESTVTKLMWAMGQSSDPQEIRKLFCATINYDMLF